MKKLLLMSTLFAGVAAFSSRLPAHDEHGKPVTLQGTLLCARCAMGESKTCITVLQVKAQSGNVNYYLADKGAKEAYHEPVCGGDKRLGAVSGVVAEKNGRKYITPTKVEYAKK